MAGTKAGGQKAAATNKALHGSDFYAANPALARIAGAKGGRISRRGKKITADAV